MNRGAAECCTKGNEGAGGPLKSTDRAEEERLTDASVYERRI